VKATPSCFATLVCATLLTAAAVAEPGRATIADLVLINGSIYTMNPARDRAEAIAVRGGRILYVGTSEGIQPYIGSSTRRIDLAGKMVLPGFQDVHIHPVSGGIVYTGCPLFDLDTLEQVLDKVRQCAQDQPDASHVYGQGWNWGVFVGSDGPHKQLLDAIDSTRPLVLGDSDGHSLWVNSAALAMAGITAASADPNGGEIGREAGGREPDGTLLEGPAMALVNSRLPAISDAQKEQALRYTQHYLHSLGITAMHDAYVSLTGNEADRALDAYRSFRDKGELQLRVVAALAWAPGQGMEQIAALRKARETYSGGRLQANTVKFWADGIIESRTAMLLEPYTDQPDTRGLLMVPRDELMAAAPLLDAAGFQLHIHAIGDATVRYALDAVEAAIKANGARDSRHLTAHTQLVHPDDIPRFGRLQVIAGFSPYWAFADSYIKDINPSQLGPDRMQQMYPIAGILATGGRVAFGSDWFVSTPDPLLAIETAVTRISPEGDPTPAFIPTQRISLDQAIAGYTIDAAYANFLDADTGSLEAGKYADLIVLDRNLFEVPAADISRARVTATVFEGELVFGGF
jgi:predicted amidohydrolase YtcJ